MIGPTETPDLDDALIALRTAERATGEEPLEFLLIYSGGMQRGIKARGWQDDTMAPTHTQVDQLEERGMVRTYDSGNVKRKFMLTDPGRRHADALAARHDSNATAATDLSWEPARELLGRLVSEYENRGAPEHGVSTKAIGQSSADVAPLLRELERADLIELGGDTDQTGAAWIRPTPEALQLLRRWPGSTGEVVVDDLIAALDARIGEASDEDERSALIKVRDGLAGAARDVAVGVITGLARDSL